MCTVCHKLYVMIGCPLIMPACYHESVIDTIWQYLHVESHAFSVLNLTTPGN